MTTKGSAAAARILLAASALLAVLAACGADAQSILPSPSPTPVPRLQGVDGERMLGLLVDRGGYVCHTAPPTESGHQWTCRRESQDPSLGTPPVDVVLLGDSLHALSSIEVTVDQTDSASADPGSVAHNTFMYFVDIAALPDAQRMAAKEFLAGTIFEPTAEVDIAGITFVVSGAITQRSLTIVAGQ